MRIFSRFLSAVVGATSLAAIAAGAPADASAAPILSASRDVQPTVPDGVILKPLPAGKDELVFRGEASSRVWEVYLSPAEASRIVAFQLGLMSTVVALPDRSTLKITINGRSLSAVPVTTSDKFAKSVLRIPPGVLVAGPNRVQVNVALTHRADCSLKATYELWAMLDPGETGFLTDLAAMSAIRTLDELGAEPAGADGATHIHLRLPDNAESETIARYAHFVDAIVRRAGLRRPIVDVGANAGEGAGIDVVLMPGAAPQAASDSLRILGKDMDVTIGREAASNRLTLVLPAVDEQDLENKIASIDGEGPPAQGDGAGFDSAMSRSFGQLDFYTEPFAGRRYFSTSDVELPPDFFPANYDKAHIFIDAAYSSVLARDSELKFRVNGAIASTLPLAAGQTGTFARQQVDLPLRYFRPGHNEIAIEGLVPSPLDQQCDVVTLSREPRLQIAESSTLEFPHLARMSSMPRIPSAVAAIAAGREKRPNLYLPNLDPASIEAGLTALANMAPTLGPTGAPEIHLEEPTNGDAPGVVISALDQLPPYLAEPLGEVARLGSDALTPLAAVDGDKSDALTAAPAIAGPLSSLAAILDPSIYREVVDPFDRAVRRIKGEKPAAMITLPAHYLLIGAVNPSSPGQADAGLSLPQLVEDPAQWLVFASPDLATLKSGMSRLIANGQWGRLAGEASSFDIDSGELKSAEPHRLAYVISGSFSLADVRPIVGGVLSDNITIGLAGFLVLVCALGLSTHVLVRRAGGRR
jgi:hypothetical protein